MSIDMLMLLVGIALAALLYSSIGHAGASGFLAVMAFHQLLRQQPANHRAHPESICRNHCDDPANSARISSLGRLGLVRAWLAAHRRLQQSIRTSQSSVSPTCRHSVDSVGRFDSVENRSSINRANAIRMPSRDSLGPFRWCLRLPSALGWEFSQG